VASDHEQGDAYRDNSILCGEARDVDAVVVCQEQIRSEDREYGESARCHVAGDPDPGKTASIVEALLGGDNASGC
jgi:hypothetical protein